MTDHMPLRSGTALASASEIRGNGVVGTIRSEPEGLPDCITMLLRDFRQHMGQPLLLETRRLRVDSAHGDFHVDRRELECRAEMSSRGWHEIPDRSQDSIKSGRHRHLLVELRRLCEVRGPVVEVRKREQLRTRFTRRARELRRMYLDEPCSLQNDRMACSMVV